MKEENRKIFERQHYALIGKNAGLQICRWTKKSLLNSGECYKQQFYGIKSHRCCQMAPCIVLCQNKCLHCWRAIEHTEGDFLAEKEADLPELLIEESIKMQRKMLTGFKGNKKTSMKKWHEAQEPSQFAISLSGEPTLYPYLGKFIKMLREKRKTTFLVTNGLNPEAIKKLEKENALPTQLYLSLNSPNNKEYEKWHNSTKKDAWKRFNKTLSLLKKLKGKTRTVIRMTLVRGKNMRDEDISGYAKLIKKASPLFLECKGFMSVGFSRKRLGYETMPVMKEVLEFSKKLGKELKIDILAKNELSRVVLLGKKEDKKRMKITKN